MLIDCDECNEQGTATCHDCIVTHVLRDVGGPLEVDDQQAGALEILAEVGLVPDLKLVPKAANS